MTDQHTYRQFYTGVLGVLGIAPTRGNLRAFGVVTLIEGRNTWWNPMNWTLPDMYPPLPGNTAGVREYPTYLTGVQQTAANLLDNSRWEPFVEALKSAKTRVGPLNAIAAIYAQWGSYPKWFAITWQQARSLLDEEMQG